MERMLAGIPSVGALAPPATIASGRFPRVLAADGEAKTPKCVGRKKVEDQEEMFS
jgi:hypothetical protein